MKRLGVKSRRGVTTIVLGLMATPAVAQYAPQPQAYPTANQGYHYPQPPTQQQPTAPPAVSQTQVGQPSYPAYRQYPQYQQPAATTPGYPATATQPSYPNSTAQQVQPQQPAQSGYSTTTAPVPGSHPGYSPYPRTAMQPRYAMQDESESVPPVPDVPQPAEPLPTPVNGQPVPHGATSDHGSTVVGGVAPHGAGYAYPAGGHGQGAYGSYIGAGDCNCNNMQAWNTYMQPYGPGQVCAADGSPLACETPRSRQWFVGIYGLYMERDRPSYQRIAVVPGMPYQTVLSTRDLDNDFTWGAEIRFGSTFGRSYDDCNPCAQRPFAWEVVYWGLTDDEQSAMYSSMPGPMSGINYAGLEYDIDGDAMVDGTVNDYFAYYDPDNPMPNAYDSTVRIRSNFKAQNLELNFLRLPLYGGCEPCSPIVVSTVCGVRYVKLDEEFQHSVMFDDGMVSGTLYHDIEVDNQLVGFQMGANMNWAIACKWDVFCDSMMGVYNNRIEVCQRVYGADGDVTFADDGMPAAVRARKDDLAFMGEMRWGLGYQVSCNCRLTAAYRVMAMTGVALATEQIPDNWSHAGQVAWVDSNDSLILHGLQLGAEFKY